MWPRSSETNSPLNKVVPEKAHEADLYSDLHRSEVASEKK